MVSSKVIIVLIVASFLTISADGAFRVEVEKSKAWEQGYKFLKKIWDAMKPEIKAQRNTNSSDDIVQSLSQMYKTQYFGSCYVGEPPKKFSFIFDTGSTNMWVASTTTFMNSILGKRFDCSESVTCKPTKKRIFMAYGKGAAFGKVVYDTVTIGGKIVRKQPMVAVTKMADFGLQKFQGIIGLAFKTKESLEPLFATMLKDKVVSLPIFTVVLEDPTKNFEKGEIIFGATDPSFYTGKLSTYKVISEDYWMIPLKAVTSQGNLLGKNISAVVDTGTSLITMPRKDWDVFSKGLGIEFSGSEEMYEVDCAKRNDVPDIHFDFGDRNFTVTSRTYIIEIPNDEAKDGVTCVLAISPLDNPGINFWLLGDTFMRQFYFEYNMDAKTIAIADLNMNKTAKSY